MKKQTQKNEIEIEKYFRNLTLMFVDFIGVCMDQLINNASKMRYMFGGQVKVPFTMLTRIGAGFGSLLFTDVRGIEDGQTSRNP